MRPANRKQARNKQTHSFTLTPAAELKLPERNKSAFVSQAIEAFNTDMSDYIQQQKVIREMGERLRGMYEGEEKI